MAHKSIIKTTFLAANLMVLVNILIAENTESITNASPATTQSGETKVSIQEIYKKYSSVDLVKAARTIIVEISKLKSDQAKNVQAIADKQFLVSYLFTEAMARAELDKASDLIKIKSEAGWYWYKSGTDRARGKDLLDQAFQGSKDDSITLVKMGLLEFYESIGQPVNLKSDEKASDFFLKSIRINDKLAEPYYMLGLYSAKAKRFDDAKKYYSKFIENSEHSIDEIYLYDDNARDLLISSVRKMMIESQK